MNEFPMRKCVGRHCGGEPKRKTNDISKLGIKGDWNIPKGKLKQKWAKHTDDDLQFVEGKLAGFR